ncbi:MAG: helix-turn-helix transcriptional regulator [Lachnospiraceae bacterium]|nr:helix-turn-helix transcriptional regulator [Lachnospiraceae bacterium]
MIKNNLVCLRKINGYSQEEIAEKIGISRQAYGKWEKGETVPDVEKCGLLASFYGITIDDLVHTTRADNGKMLPPPPKGKHIFGTATVSNRGQIVIPQQARMIFEIKGGDRLVVLGDEAEGIALVKEKTFMDRMNMAMKLASDELPDDMEEERNG